MRESVSSVTTGKKCGLWHCQSLDTPMAQNNEIGEDGKEEGKGLVYKEFLTR